MNKVYRWMPILAGLAGAMGTGSLSACGDDTTSSGTGDGGGDAIEEGQTDAPASNESGPGVDAARDAPVVDSTSVDVQQMEAGSDADATTADGSDGSNPDTGVDSSMPETGTPETGGPEAGADSSEAAASDGSDMLDGGADAANAALGFPGQVAAAICSRNAACCGTTGDAASFDWQACYNAYLPVGFKGSSTGFNLFGRGNVSFDSAQADACLAGIAAVDCTSNQVTAAEFDQLFQSCFGAYTGTLPTGSPCAGAIECSTGNYCAPGDGGTNDAGDIGTCETLVGNGGACGNSGILTTGQSMCSYRGASSNGLFCKNINPDAGLTELPSAQWTCAPQWGVATSCWTAQDCTSFICHEDSPTDYECASAGDWANTSTCSTYVIGGGG